MEEKRGRREGWRKKGEGINKKSKSDGKERFRSSREEKKKEMVICTVYISSHL